MDQLQLIKMVSKKEEKMIDDDSKGRFEQFSFQRGIQILGLYKRQSPRFRSASTEAVTHKTPGMPGGIYMVFRKNPG